MKTLFFKIMLHASPVRVWEVMLTQETYRIWTSVFAKGSRFEGSWEQGARIRFVGPDGNGMTSVVAENRPHELVSVQHLGMIRNGTEDLASEMAKSWTPSFETYRFTPVGSATELEVTIDVPEKYQDYMEKTWPLALARLKELCEEGR